MKSKILIIGVTGSLGFDLAKASVHASHPTYGLVRDSAFSDPNKSEKLRMLSDSGVTLLKSSLQDEDGLIEAIKQVDVVICSIPSKHVLDQKLLVRAIKRAGCVKRFIPSEFGSDPDKTQVSDLDNGFYSRKAEIRRLIEAEHIPYTYICCNFFMRYLLPSLVQPGLKSPPREKVTIYGDGTVKGVFVKESDVAAFTICTVDDPCTLNKTLYLRPPGNVYSMNELVEIWENKIGKELQKTYITEEELLKKIKVCHVQFSNSISEQHGAGFHIFCICKGGSDVLLHRILRWSRRVAAVSTPHGDIYDHGTLVNAIKQVDVVISTVGREQLADQTNIIAAIKEAGNVKRFFPSEFGNDADRVHPVEPAKTMYEAKVRIRRMVEDEGIPYTYVANNFFADRFLRTLSQPGATAPPRDKIVIFGDGNPEAVFNKEEDIATYTIKAVDDPQTLNKVLYVRPPQNTISFNDLISLWEKKIGKILERTYVTEEQLLRNIQEASFPMNAILSIWHTAYVKGDHTNFKIESSFGVEASELYPDVKYTTVDEILNQLV